MKTMNQYNGQMFNHCNSRIRAAFPSDEPILSPPLL